MKRTTLLYPITITLLQAVAMLPLSLLYALSDVAFLVVYYVVRYRRKRVRANIEHSFSELDMHEHRQIEQRFYRHLCDTVVETVKLLHISDDEMRAHVNVTGSELIEQAAADERPVFLFIGHIGNWEWVQEVTRRISAPSVCGELYRPLHSEVFDHVMQAIRTQRYHTQLIPVKQAVRAIIGLRREYPSFLIGFIGDQRPTRHSLNHWMTFLGQDTPYMVGGEEIGRHVDAKFLMLHVRKPRRGHYDMTIRDMQLPPELSQPKKGEYPYIEMYMRALETNIREQPEIYLWSHNRWKHQRT